MSLKPICVPCQRFFQVVHNGKTVLEQMPSSKARPGRIDSQLWKPYKLWSGDKWQCPGCQAEIVVGTGARAYHEAHEPGFEFELARRVKEGLVVVNDC